MSLKKLLRLGIISIAIAAAILIVNMLYSSRIYALERYAIDFSINFLFAFTITISNEYYFDRLNLWLPWSVRPALRLSLGVIGSVILTMGLLFILIALVSIAIYGNSWDQFINGQSLTFYLTGVLITLFMATVFHAFYFYKEIQNLRYTEQKMIAGTATAQFDALKNQLDPHFLFNSLNVLVSLIEENPEAATNFTTSLSKVYRYVLEQRGKPLVALEEELSFARTYVQLLKMRFEDSLEIMLPTGEQPADLQLVPLSLQLLIENAVKHNVIGPRQPLRLSIYIENGNLILENNLQKKATVAVGTGVGLTNIISRYALLTDQSVMIDDKEGSFKVHLPLLHVNHVASVKNNKMKEKDAITKLGRAHEQVKKLKSFYDDVFKTIVFILFLGLLNYFTTDFPWVLFPAIGMGLGLFFNYQKNIGAGLILGKKWDERKINQLMNDKKF